MRHGFNSNWRVPAHRDSGNVGFQHLAKALGSALHGNENARQNEQASNTYTALGTGASSHAKEQMHADTKALMFDALDTRAPASKNGLSQNGYGSFIGLRYST